MINPMVLHTAVYNYNLPCQGISNSNKMVETVANSRYCSSGYFLEKISTVGSGLEEKSYSFRNRLVSCRVFCGAFSLKGYRRPPSGPRPSVEEMIEDLRSLW